MVAQFTHRDHGAGLRRTLRDWRGFKASGAERGEGVAEDFAVGKKQLTAGGGGGDGGLAQGLGM